MLEVLFFYSFFFGFYSNFRFQFKLYIHSTTVFCVFKVFFREIFPRFRGRNAISLISCQFCIQFFSISGKADPDFTPLKFSWRSNTFTTWTWFTGTWNQRIFLLTAGGTARWQILGFARKLTDVLGPCVELLSTWLPKLSSAR